MELFSITETADIWAGLPTDPDTGVAALELERTGLSTELSVTGLTTEPETLVVGTLPQTGLLAGNTGLRTGLPAVRVTTASLTVLGAETG